MWNIAPRMDLLIENGENHAYLSAKEGKYYLLYFTGAGVVKLDLRRHPGNFKTKWIAPETASWTKESTTEGGGIVTLECPFEEGGFAILYSS